jgi:hypothetical protein
MTPTQQNQLAGFCLVLGGAYAVIWGAAHVIPAVLIVMGLLVLNLRQLTGALGRLGLIALIAGLAAGGILELLGAIAPSVLASLGVTVYLILGLVLSAGMVLYGIATVRAGRFRGGELLIAGPLLTIIAGSWGAKLGAVGLVVLGYFLFTAKVDQTDSTAIVI